MFASVRCCFDVMFLLLASLFALSEQKSFLSNLTVADFQEKSGGKGAEFTEYFRRNTCT